MADDETAKGEGITTERAPPPPPVQVAYCPITGIPAEYNEYLPKDSEEYKKWKVHLGQALPASEVAASEVAASIDGLSLEEGSSKPEGTAVAAADGEEKKMPGGKKKKVSKAIVIEATARQKNKRTTTVTGLDGVGVKLADAAKIFKTKFACGCSVVKNPSLVEQIEIQGDFVDKVAELILKTYEKSHQVTKDLIWVIEVADEKKKKRRFFDDGSDDGDA